MSKNIKMMKNIDTLDALLNESKQLITTHAVPTIRPPTVSHVPKNLQSIYHQSKKLNQKVARTVTDTAPKGDLLLAQKGFDVEKYRRGIYAIDLRSAFEPLEPLGETDIDAFLKHQHSMIMLTAVEEAKKSTSNEFYSKYDSCINADWEAAKKDLRQVLSQHKQTSERDDLLSLERHPMTSYHSIPYSSSGLEQVPFTPGKRGRTKMDNRMIEYSAVVYKLNIAMKRDNEFNEIVSQFIEHAELIAERESRKRDVIESWKVLKYMFNESSTTERVVTHQFEEHELLEGAKSALAAQYAEFISEVVATHAPREFGELNKQSHNYNLSLIQQYLSIVRNRDRTNFERDVVIVNGEPIWAVIYYCLRCGFVNEALQYASKLPLVTDSVIYSYLRSYGSKFDTSRSSHEQVNKDYRENAHTDIFRKALYLLLGACEPNNSYTKVFSKTEDWIWYKLHLVNKANYTLADLRKKITDCGPQYFCGNAQSLKYFRLLLYTQQFEEAVAYLYGRTIEGYQVEAVHFAIALYMYGRLKLASDQTAPLLSTEKKVTVLNFYFLLRDYVKYFAHTNPRDAVSYYSVLARPSLRSVGGDYERRDKEICLKYLVDLVIETNDISTLLGSIETDGKRKRGCIEDFLPAEDAFYVLEKSAQQYHRIGRYHNAVELYFMAEAPLRIYNTVNPKSSQYLTNILQIMNNELSQVLTNGDNRNIVIQLASKVNMKFIQSNLKAIMREADKKYFDTFSLLLRLISFFNLYDARKYFEAYELIAQSGIIPFQRDKIDEAVKNFHSLDETIQRKIADIISVCMNTLHQLYMYEKSRPNSISQQTEIRHRADTLLTFAGYIQSFISSEYYGKLIKLHVAMGS